MERSFQNLKNFAETALLFFAGNLTNDRGLMSCNATPSLTGVELWFRLQLGFVNWGRVTVTVRVR